MDPVAKHSQAADASFDGGELDCGNGLLLLLRKHLDKLDAGQLLEIRSLEVSVDEDLPAWCRLTKNELVSWTRKGKQRSFLVRKADPASKSRALSTTDSSTSPATDGSISPATNISTSSANDGDTSSTVDVHQTQLKTQRANTPFVGEIAPLSVMGIGSWPRPPWLIRALHEYLQGRMSDKDFHETANDAVKLAISAQIAAGVDLVTDGEQRRDNYSSFVGTRLENCQLIPLVDLLPLVDDPDDFSRKLDSLDVPADKVRHPVVLGKISRKRPLVMHEFDYAKTLTDKPFKVALPGPYLLSRTMWMECIADKAYDSREQLANDIVDVLRAELADLLNAGVALVQFDEPVLTEVVFAKTTGDRGFMCGALSERAAPEEELSFARTLINALVAGFPKERLAVHVCRGNWTPDESVALTGDYTPLLPLLSSLHVGTLFLEYCTPRAGELSLLSQLPKEMRVGLGVVNPKSPEVESVDSIVAKIQEASRYVSIERLLLNPDCGFATFADNPLCDSSLAERKLAAIREAAVLMRKNG